MEVAERVHSSLTMSIFLILRRRISRYLKSLNLKYQAPVRRSVLSVERVSSKSSLVQLIPRLYDVTTGAVNVGGVDVRDYDIESTA